MNRGTWAGDCLLCGGTKKPGTTIYSVDLGTGVVIVRNVPASVCSQCGEEWIDNDIALKLERITEEARKKGLQLEVIAL